MGASENALLEQLVLSTNTETHSLGSHMVVLFLYWFQGKFPGEKVLWVVPQLQDSPGTKACGAQVCPSATGVRAASFLKISIRSLSNAATCTHCIPVCFLGRYGP